MSKLPSILKSPASQATYARVVAEARKLGPFEVEEKKTSLHLTHGRAFAGVHPRATGIILNLVLDAPLKSARVHKSEQVSANRHHVEFKLEDPADVDARLDEESLLPHSLMSCVMRSCTLCSEGQGARRGTPTSP